MQDNENYLGKAGAYLQGMDEVGRPSRASEPRLANLVGLAQAEQTGILAGVQARIADAMEEANRIKRIELGLENPQTGGVADRFTAIPDLSGQRPSDAPTG